MINHEKEIYLIFLLAVDRSWLSIRQASWTRFTIDHSKIQMNASSLLVMGYLAS